jgi:hypothetical protein
VIRFSCPRCNAVLRASDRRAGDKIPCPKCRQRLQIPGPPRNKTVLAPVVPTPIVIDPGPPPPKSLPANTPPPPVHPEMPHTWGPKPPGLRAILLFLVAVGSATALVILLLFGLFMFAFPEGTPNPLPDLSHVGWTSGVDSASSGPLQVSVLLVELEQGMSVIYLLAENRSDTQKIDFAKDLNTPNRPHIVKITDEFDNQYQLPARLNHPLIIQGILGLRPKEFVIYVMPAQVPVDKAQRLYLEMSSLVIESDDTFKFKLPIKRETITHEQLPVISFPFGLAEAKPVTRTVLFKRDDFETWGKKFRQLVAKQP